jgi:hypothetical protein
MSSDLIIGIASFLLTLMILSYLIGDNPAFRFAVYLFIGASAGYAAAVVCWQVLWTRLVAPILKGDSDAIGIVFTIIASLLGVLLLMKLSPRTARLGNPSVALLVGVAAAVAIGGAVTGTLLPQTQASINVFQLSNAGQYIIKNVFYGLIMMVGTITTLVYFHFGAKATPTGPQRSKLVNILGWVGQIFIAITLGVLFAGVLSASLTALIERISSIIEFVSKTIF